MAITRGRRSKNLEGSERSEGDWSIGGADWWADSVKKESARPHSLCQCWVMSKVGDLFSYWFGL